MANSDQPLTELVQLSLDSKEMRAVAISLRFAASTMLGDVKDQIIMLPDLVDAFKDLDAPGYNKLQAKIVRLATAGFSDLEIHIEQDPDGILADMCKHCSCDDPICCWCGRKKQ